MTVSDVGGLLRGVDSQLRGLRSAKRRLARALAPDFNALSILGPRETQLSRILRELLDPEGAHAQGSDFLQLFLKDFLPDSWHSLAPEFRRARCEVSTRLHASGRFMDLRIDFRDAVLVIENKPWHGDGDAQVSDYLKEMELGTRHHALLYISGNGAGPEVKSIPKEQLALAIRAERFFLTGYRELGAWAGRCATRCEAESVRTFLKTLQRYIEIEFEGKVEMNEEAAIVEQCTASEVAVRSALLVVRSVNAIRQSLLLTLRDQLFQEIRDRSLSWTLDWQIDPTVPNTTLRISYSQGQAYLIAFGFERTNCRDAHFGILKSRDGLDDLPDLGGVLDVHFWNRSYRSPHWPWYLYCAGEYLQWDSSDLPWIEIAQARTMAGRILQIATKIRNALEDAGMLLLLFDSRPGNSDAALLTPKPVE